MKRKTMNRVSITLTVLGVAGSIGTAILTAERTPKAIQLVKEAEEKKGRELTTNEKIVVGAKAYAPAIGMGVATIACILGAGALSYRAQKSLMSAYALLSEQYKMYRKTNIELFGEENDEAIIESMVAMQYPEICTRTDTPDTKRTFVEPVTGKVFEAYERDVIMAEYHLNRNMMSRGYATLNEFLAFLRLEPDDPDNVGWTYCDGYMWIDISHEEDKDGSLVINYTFYPDESYKEEWGEP